VQDALHVVDEVVGEVLAAGPLVEAELTLIGDRRGGGAVEQLVALGAGQLAGVVAGELASCSSSFHQDPTTVVLSAIRPSSSLFV